MLVSLMDDQALDRIFAVEKELSAHLDAEAEKIAAWLDKVSRETGEELKEEEQGLIAALAEAAERIRREAFDEAARKKSDAEARSRAMEAVSDDRIREIVRKQLQRILPETP